MKRIALAALLTACGAHPHDPTFDVYANEFYAEAEARGVEVPRIPIAFVEEFDGAVQAVCLNRSHIQVSRKFWYTTSAAAKRALVFHELGHCALHLGHTERGIMRHTLYFTTNEAAWSNAVEELFQ